MRDKKNRLRVAIYMRVAQKEQCEEAVTAMKSQEAVLEQITQNSGTGNGKERTSRRPFDEKREPLGKECKRKLTSGRSSA